MHDPLPEPSFWLELAFQGLVALLLAGFVVAVRFASGPSATRRAAACAIGLLFVSGALALNGKLAFGPMPPPLMVHAFVCASAGVVLAFSRIGRQLASALSFQWLIGFQTFRLPLQLMVNEGYNEGVVPRPLSFQGYDFDILTGASALVVAVLFAQGRVGRRTLWTWNVVGSLLLLVTVAIAILCMPTPLRVFMDEPPNVWVTWWPFVWLPTFLVPAALLGHLLVFRKLLQGEGDGRVSVRRSSRP